jgi:hypothetical protein
VEIKRELVQDTETTLLELSNMVLSHLTTRQEHYYGVEKLSYNAEIP